MDNDLKNWDEFNLIIYVGNSEIRIRKYEGHSKIIKRFYVSIFVCIMRIIQSICSAHLK